MNCLLCNHETIPGHKARVLNKYDVQYFFCTECEFIQSEKPYWLEESYASSIAVSDTGIIVRNEYYVKYFAVLLRLLFFSSHSKFLDYGGGHGIFTRMMRDRGFQFSWSDKYSANHYARGFEEESIDTIYDAITSIESAEHWSDPDREIKSILSRTDTFIFTTELAPTKNPSPKDWWYYCPEHGQHISLYSKKTFEEYARKEHLNFISNGFNIHILSRKKYSSLIFKICGCILKLKLERLLALPSLTDSDRLKITGNAHD